MFAHLATNARDRNTHFNAFICVDTAADFVTFLLFFFSRTQTKQQIETMRCNCISSNSKGSGKNEQKISANK